MAAASDPPSRAAIARLERLEADRRRQIAVIFDRVKWSASGPGTPRETLHALLDAILDLAKLQHPDALRRQEWKEPAAKAARILGRDLLRAALGWTEPQAPVTAAPPLGADAWADLAANPTRWRCELRERLAWSPSLVPLQLVDQLSSAIAALDDGSGIVLPQFEPVRAPGRGTNPLEARRCEEKAWLWIAKEKGAGRRVADAVADVARAVKRSTDAVKKWREAWEVREAELAGGDRKAGRAAVKGLLKINQAIGAMPHPDGYREAELKIIAERWIASIQPDPRMREG